MLLYHDISQLFIMRYDVWANQRHTDSIYHNFHTRANLNLWEIIELCKTTWRQNLQLLVQTNQQEKRNIRVESKQKLTNFNKSCKSWMYNSGVQKIVMLFSEMLRHFFLGSIVVATKDFYFLTLSCHTASPPQCALTSCFFLHTWGSLICTKNNQTLVP